MRIKTKEAIAGYAFALPSLMGFGMLFMVPFVISLFYCFTKGIGDVEFVGLKNFAELFGSSSFRLASENTLKFNLISVPLIMILSFLLAELLNRKLKGIEYFRMLLTIPLVIPVASVILVWQVVFHEQGVLNRLFHSNIEWMKSEWSIGVLVLLYIWKNCGYNTILLLAGLNSIPKQHYEAAYLDGAGIWTCLRRVTFPFLMPTVFFVFVISLINSFKVFREAYLLAGSYPHEDIYMLQHFMNNNFINLNYSRLTTAAFLMATVVFTVVYILYKLEGRYGSN